MQRCTFFSHLSVACHTKTLALLSVCIFKVNSSRNIHLHTRLSLYHVNVVDRYTVWRGKHDCARPDIVLETPGSVLDAAVHPRGSPAPHLDGTALHLLL